MLSHENIPRSHRQLQDQLAAQTAAFLSAGGEIKRPDLDGREIIKADFNGRNGNKIAAENKKRKKVQ